MAKPGTHESGSFRYSRLIRVTHKTSREDERTWVARHRLSSANLAGSAQRGPVKIIACRVFPVPDLSFIYVLTQLHNVHGSNVVRLSQVRILYAWPQGAGVRRFGDRQLRRTAPPLSVLHNFTWDAGRRRSVTYRQEPVNSSGVSRCWWFESTSPEDITHLHPAHVPRRGSKDRRLPTANRIPPVITTFIYAARTVDRRKKVP